MVWISVTSNIQPEWQSHKTQSKREEIVLALDTLSSQNWIIIMWVKSMALVSWQHQTFNVWFSYKFAAFAVGSYQTGPFGGTLTKWDEGENQLHSVDLYNFLQ